MEAPGTQAAWHLQKGREREPGRSLMGTVPEDTW